jgi:exosortase
MPHAKLRPYPRGATFLNLQPEVAPADIAWSRQPQPFRTWFTGQVRSYWLLWLGLAAIVLPTMYSIARISWSDEQSAHGPIVLATGIWLISRIWNDILRVARPGSLALTLAILIPSLAVYLLAVITGIVEFEGFAMYGVVIAVLYSAGGGPVMRLLWFPLLYLAFTLPLPESLVAAITQPLKIGISEVAVKMLYALGYPVAGSGVTIQIAQFQLLVAAACAGLNSLISLTAIGLFYVYIRHNANWRYAALIMLAIIPAAIFANFARVVILILITYHFGDAAAQGFLHNFAGVTMFIISVLVIFAVDSLASPLRSRLGKE